MSQEKVELRKKKKANHKKEMRIEKLQRMLCALLGIVIAAAIVVWIGFSIYQNQSKSGDTATNPSSVEVNTDALEDYLDELDDAQ